MFAAGMVGTLESRPSTSDPKSLSKFCSSAPNRNYRTLRRPFVFPKVLNLKDTTLKKE